MSIRIKCKEMCQQTEWPLCRQLHRRPWLQSPSRFGRFCSWWDPYYTRRALGASSSQASKARSELHSHRLGANHTGSRELQRGFSISKDGTGSKREEGPRFCRLGNAVTQVGRVRRP